MFIEIKPHKGVWVNTSNFPHKYELEQSYRLNLNLVNEVIFEKREIFELDGEIGEKTDSYGLSGTFSKYRKFSKENTTFSKENTTSEREQGPTGFFALLMEKEEPPTPKPRKIAVNVIHFISLNENYDNLSLCFTKEGEGEFQRIKRIIDENTFK